MPWTFKGYRIFRSVDKPNKKYYALVGNRRVYFGARAYQHYRDRLGAYSRLDHLDPERRRRFKQRFERYRHRRGTAAWFADQILW